MKKILLLFWFVLWFGEIRAQRYPIDRDSLFIVAVEHVDGPAHFREKENGRKLFILNDDVLVQTTADRNGWLIGGVYVRTTEEENLREYILPGTLLRSPDGKIIGEALDTVRGFPEWDDVWFINGYTYQDNIKPESIPEIALKDLLDSGKIKSHDYSLFMTNFRFRKDFFEDGIELDQWGISESIIEDYTPQDRITLFFDSSGMLVGVIHSRPLILNKAYPQIPMERGRILTVIGSSDSRPVKEIILKRNHFYNSTD